MKKLLLIMALALTTTLNMMAISIDAAFEKAQKTGKGELTELKGDQLKMFMSLAGQNTLTDKAESMRIYTIENATAKDKKEIVDIFTTEDIDGYTKFDDSDGDIMWMRVNYNTGKVTGMLIVSVEDTEVTATEMVINMSMEDLAKMAK